MVAHRLLLSALAAAIAVASGDALAQGSNERAPRAELQILLCEPVDVLERKLALRPRGAAYETWLFDDPTLFLVNHGMRLRLRVRAEGSELTLKVAAQDCHALAPGLVPRREGKCEFDVHGGKLEGVVSLTRSLTSGATRELLGRRTPVAQALSAAQSRFLREVTGVWPLPADLRPLGPIANRVYVTKGQAYDVDITTLPDGARYAEIATKVALADIETARRSLESHLANAGVNVCSDQSGQAAAKLKRLAGG